MSKNLDNYGDALTVKDLYDILPIGMNAVRWLVTDGYIKSLKIGNRYIIPKTAVQEFLNSAV